MSKQDTLDRLKNDPDAVVRFVIDNNPSGVQSNLDALGLLPSNLPNPTKADMYRIVTKLTQVDSETNREAFNFVLSVNYNNEATNYTGGMADLLGNAIL